MPDIPGVDVASWQGEPGQWVNHPAARGIQWAAVKFTEVSTQYGTYENPQAKADWDWLWENKKGRIAYLFAHPAASVSDTVAAFRSMTEKLGLLPEDGIAVDLETTDGMSPAEVSSWARELLAELAALYGRRPILYTYLNFALSGNCEGLENYLLWIASITTAGMPQVPAPWRDWFAQQYVLAQPNSVDQDVAHFSSLAAMQAAMGQAQFKTVEAVHVTTGEDTMVSLSHLLQCEISEMLGLTLNAQADRMFSGNLKDYLDYGNLQAFIPKGVAIRYMETVRA